MLSTGARLFPLTPALSLVERENRPPLRGESNALGRAGVSALNRRAHGASENDARLEKPQDARSPSPRRGRTVRCAFANSERPDSSQRGLRCSLSLREGQGEGEGGLQLPGVRRFGSRGPLLSFAQCNRLHRQFAAALGCGGFLPPHPGPLPLGGGEGECFADLGGLIV